MRWPEVTAQSHLPLKHLFERSVPQRSHTPSKPSSTSATSHSSRHSCRFLGPANLVQRWTTAVVCLPCATIIGTSSSFLTTRISPLRSTRLLATSHATKVGHQYHQMLLAHVQKATKNYIDTTSQRTASYQHCALTSAHSNLRLRFVFLYITGDRRNIRRCYNTSNEGLAQTLLSRCKSLLTASDFSKIIPTGNVTTRGSNGT